MTVPFPTPVTFVTRTASGRDSDGNTTYTETAAAVPDVVFAPAGSVEQIAGRDTVTDQDTLYFPLRILTSTDLDPVDEVDIDGDRYQVDGTPQRFRNPFTNYTGTVVRLEKVTG